MFRKYLTVGTVAGTADITETSTAVLTLVSTNYSHVTKVHFYQPVKPDSRKLKELQHAHKVHSLHSYRLKPIRLFLFNEI